MQFDPALAAQAALQEAEIELGSDWETAVELEHTFSSNAGATARKAYEALLTLAQRHPEAHSFQAFCIYITWQQVTEETIPAHFQKGAELCDRYLSRLARGHDETQADQIRALRRSFRAGLGQSDDDDAEYDADTPKGGD